MKGYRFTLIHGGGVLYLLLLILFFLMAMPFGRGEALAQGGSGESGTSLGGMLADAGAAGWLIILLGIATIVVTLIGAGGVRKEQPWPHWHRLVRGLGEAAFLLGLTGTVFGMIMALSEITRLGAAVTPSDMGGGLTRSLLSVLLGVLVSLLALICGGVLRLSEPARE